MSGNSENLQALKESGALKPASEIEQPAPQEPEVAAPVSPLSFPLSNSMEAPAIIFTQVYTEKDGSVIQFNITQRADTIAMALDALMAGLEYGKTKYKLSLKNPHDGKQIPAPAKPAAAAPVPPQRPVGSPVTPHAPAKSGAPAPVVPGAPIDTTTQHVFTCHKLEVVLRSDGKVDLKFYDAAHPAYRFAEVTKTATAEQLCELLSGTGSWSPAHFAAAGFIPNKDGNPPLNYKVTWVNSPKLNSKSHPYKDIISVTP